MALDNFRKVNITLNKANQRVLETQIAKVGDANGRELVVQITNNGVIEDQTGTTLKLNWQHENGKQGSTAFNVVDIKTGTFSVYYPKEMLYKGKVNANIEITSNGQITNSMNFKIIVKADVFDGEGGIVDGVFISLAEVNKKLDDREAEYVELKNRQTSVENQFNSVQQELTGKDVISAPEIIAARNGEATLSERLDKEQQEVNAQLAHTETYAEQKTGHQTINNLRIIFQYNYENNHEKLKRLKALGINCIMSSFSVNAEWIRDVTRVKAFIQRNLDQGIYTILSLNHQTLNDTVAYNSELSFFSEVEAELGLIGFYIFDEPVWNEIPKEKQIQVYNDFKSFTDKSIFISEVMNVAGREEKFTNFYTPDCYDYYIINTYLSHSTKEQIPLSIKDAIVNFSKIGFKTPRNIIANFPFYTDSDYPHPPTEETTRALVEGWKPFFSGNYAVFAHNNPLLTSDIDTNPEYIPLVQIVSTLPGSKPDTVYAYDGFEVLEGKASLNDGEAKTLKIGGGTQLKKYVTIAQSIDLGVISANSHKEFNITGADVLAGDGVFVTPFSSPPAGLLWEASIPFDGTLRIRVYNVTGAVITLTSRTWYFDVFKR